MEERKQGHAVSGVLWEKENKPCRHGIHMQITETIIHEQQSMSKVNMLNFIRDALLYEQTYEADAKEWCPMWTLRYITTPES